MTLGSVFVSDNEQDEPAEDGNLGWDTGRAPRAKRRRTRASTGTTGTSCRSLNSREIGIMRDGNTHGSAKFVGSASGIQFVRTVYRAFARMSNDRMQQSTNNSHDKDLVPGEDDQLHSNDNRSCPQVSSGGLWYGQELDHKNPRPSLLEFDRMVEWTQSYFENWHPTFPFLHSLFYMRRRPSESWTRLAEKE